MNSDYIIGSRNPQVLMARSLDDASRGNRVAYPEDEAPAPQAAPTTPVETVNMAAIEVTPADARDTVRESGTSSEGGRRERGRGPEAMEADLSFGDVLDILNPLQHIPIISDIYRESTGDTIQSYAEVVGNALFSGPIGLITGAFNAMFKDETGKSTGETMIAAIFGDSDVLEEPKLETQLAEAEQKVVAGETKLAASTPVPATLDRQTAVAANTQVPSTLEAQMQGAMLPPVPPGKAPFGGVMDVASMKAAAEKAKIKTAAPHLTNQPPEAGEPKFYSLAGARRRGDERVSMPIHSGPDVRLKNISRQAVSGHASSPLPGTQTAAQVTDPQTAAALGLAPETATVARLNDTPPLLTPDDADLLPAYGNNSQSLPPALIEDMMRQGLEKYQKGIESGTLSAPSAVDIRG